MNQVTVQINGMFCGMCEAHINDTIRKAFPGASKVSSSSSKGQASFLSETLLEEEELKKAISATGYEFVSMKQEPYEKKSLFQRLRK